MIQYDELKWIMTKLPVPNGYRAGQALELVEWQDQLLQKCFTQARRPEIVYVEIPRKNGKTTFTAGLLAGLFVADPEPGAEFYCCSGDKEQAGIIFNIANYMITNTPSFSKRIRVVPSTKKFISNSDPTRFFRSLSADAHSKHGYNPYFTVFDELHIFKTRDLWDVMDTGDVARDNPMKFIITTAGNDMSTLCGEMHEHALDVHAGKVQDPAFFSTVFTVKDTKRWMDEEQWAYANPSIGKLIKIDKLRAKYTRAKGKTVAEAAFKRLHLDIWQESEYQWIDVEVFWQASTPNVADSHIHGGVGGLDLGFGHDPTSFTIYKSGKEKSFFKTWVWMTDDEARSLEKLHGTKWTEWMRDKHVLRYGKDVADYEVLERDLVEIARKHSVKKIAYDRWKSHQLINNIGRKFETVPVGQGFASMTMPIKHVEALIAAQKLVWEANPAVKEAFKRVYIKQDAAGNAKPDKQKSWHKIDPVVSLLTAVAVAESTAQKKSVYETRGLI